MNKIIIGVIALTLMLAGCGSFFTVKPTAEDVSLAQKDVTAAAQLTAIEKPEWKASMLKVSDAAVSGLNAGKITTLEGVQTLINQEAVNMHFSEQTVKDAKAFMVLLVLYVDQKGQVSLNVPVQLCLVAQWVNNAIGGTAKCTQELVTAATAT